MKTIILSTILLAFSSAASADFVCQVNANIWTGVPNATDSNVAVVNTGTLFRGTDIDQCAKAQALYTRLFGELLIELYPTPDAGIKVGRMLMGK